jgi:hypothetical protein
MPKNRITEFLPNHDADHAIPPGTGTVHEGFIYDPYGLHSTSDADWSVGNGMEWSFMYQSPRADSKDGLHADRLRDISPDLGRWIDHDAVGYIEGASLHPTVDPIIAGEEVGEESGTT